MSSTSLLLILGMVSRLKLGPNISVSSSLVSLEVLALANVLVISVSSAKLVATRKVAICICSRSCRY